MIFSGTLPATRVAVEFYDAGFLTFGRATMGGMAALVTLVLMQRRFPRDHVKPLLFAGIMLVFGFPAFTTIAMTSVPSAHGGVVLGILPLATAIFSVILAGERPSPLFWICGVIGSLLIVFFALRDGGWSLQWGDLWLAAAVIAASSGYVVSGKLSQIMPGWEVICWALVLCLPPSIIATIWFWNHDYLSAPTPQFLAFLYVGLGSMFLGFFAWNTGLQLGGIARIGQLQLLQTFFTLAIAALVLDESVPIETWGFAIAVLLVILVGRKARISTINSSDK